MPPDAPPPPAPPLCDGDTDGVACYEYATYGEAVAACNAQDFSAGTVFAIAAAASLSCTPSEVATWTDTCEFPIADEAGCLAYATSVGKQEWAIHHAEHPVGCVRLLSNDKAIHWNFHPTGADSTNARRICGCPVPPAAPPPPHDCSACVAGQWSNGGADCTGGQGAYYAPLDACLNPARTAYCRHPVTDEFPVSDCSGSGSGRRLSESPIAAEGCSVTGTASGTYKACQCAAA